MLERTDEKDSVTWVNGSIGTQTLDVVRASPEKFKIEVLAAGSSIDAIRKQITEFSPSIVIMYDVRAAKILDEEFPNTTVLSSKDVAQRISGGSISSLTQ